MTALNKNKTENITNIK